MVMAMSHRLKKTTTTRVPKCNAVKQTHKVDLGWYHYKAKQASYVHVREKTGGGRRTVNLRKDFNKIDIINECTELFFPNGMNQHGHLKVMEVNLSDFALMPLSDEHTTIGDMVDKVKLNKLKFYLKTRLRRSSSTRERNTNDTESSDGDISPMSRQRVHSPLGSPPSAQHASSTLSLPPLAQHARSTLGSPPSAQHASSTLSLPPLAQHASSTLSLPPLAQHARSTLSTPPSAQCASSKEYITLMPPHYMPAQQKACLQEHHQRTMTMCTC